MLEAFASTDKGCVRSNNEDYWLIQPDLGLYVVADGMGGARAGEQASRLAVDTVAEMVQSATMKFRYPQLWTRLTLPKLERELEGVMNLITDGLCPHLQKAHAGIEPSFEREAERGRAQLHA